ncbi:GNAT family N-acetyltransferase [Eubacterium limosum]|uniref:GNAT family N-acetyltransferase n=1 Tax=Eubacterium limosum TaxID=1736 RepID=A0ABT5URH6_EUBLI|nr:GNAT family N-acetyltransferase [Eubacterium limosum]MCB6570183.1 GNAT family N-acetyltransferase [Eubacterium limosum]MDE1471557.1 GNAT family N-acetyltransferase [Eubacterium limosum]
MEITYRKLGSGDMDTFIKMRIQQLQEEGAEPVLDLSSELRSYYTRHLEDQTFSAWLAVDEEAIVGTCGLSVVEKPPYYANPTGRIGLLSSVYTLKSHRRRGIARGLLEHIMDEANSAGCGAVQITASDMGTLLYADYGFKRNENFMQFVL